MSGRHEFRALTSARGIAAWMVVMFHVQYGVADMPRQWKQAFGFGYLAVDFFFLLSGFVIWYSWGPRLRRGNWGDVATFLQKRIARIWPLHLVMLTAAVALAGTLWMSGRPDPGTYPVGELPLHIFLVQNWGFTDRLSWNVPAWSISCELAAYLVFPLLVRTVDWDALPGALVIAVVGALVVLLGWIIAMSPSTAFDIPHYGLIRCLVEFIIGGAMCSLWSRWRNSPLVPTLVAASVSMIGVAGWFAGLSEVLIAPVTFAALLLTLAMTSAMRGNPLAWRPLHYLGEISYATYLSHSVLLAAFKAFVISDARPTSPTLIALYLILVLLCSIALYHLVERPAQRWVNAIRLPRRRVRALGVG